MSLKVKVKAQVLGVERAT